MRPESRLVTRVLASAGLTSTDTLFLRERVNDGCMGTGFH